MKPPSRPAPSLVAAEVAEAVKLPPGVAQGALMDMGRLPDGTPTSPHRNNLSDRQIMDKWGIPTAKYSQLKSMGESALRQMRAAATERSFILAAALQDSLMNDLVVVAEDGTMTESPAMQKMTPEQKSRMLKSITDAAVTFQDGHASAGSPVDNARAVVAALEQRQAALPKLLPPPAANAS